MVYKIRKPNSCNLCCISVLVKASYNIIRKVAGTYYLTQHVGIGLISAVIITAATILIFGNKFCLDIYTRINRFIGNIVMKN